MSFIISGFADCTHTVLNIAQIEEDYSLYLDEAIIIVLENRKDM